MLRGVYFIFFFAYARYRWMILHSPPRLPASSCRLLLIPFLGARAGGYAFISMRIAFEGAFRRSLISARRARRLMRFAAARWLFCHGGAAALLLDYGQDIIFITWHFISLGITCAYAH